MRTLATAPDLYPTFVDLQCVPSLLGLLSHENSDISIAVVDLIQELTDIDTLNESEDGRALILHYKLIMTLLVHGPILRTPLLLQLVFIMRT